MLGGGGGNGEPMFPAFLEENSYQYDATALPQLQLFGDVPVGGNVDPINYQGSDHAIATNQPIKRNREPEQFSRQQKLHISLNNNLVLDETGHSGSILNPNPVSTGLRLSYEEEEHNSSVTCATENMKSSLPGIFSLSNSVKMEMVRQKEQLNYYIKLQEENLVKGIKELNQRHTVSLLNALEKGVSTKLQEKDLEIESINRKNKELGERIKQVAMEAQSWHHRAKYNESVVNVLKSNLQQVIAQGAGQAQEGCGDSEVDDAASYTNYQGIQNGSRNPGSLKQFKCRACKVKEVSILLLPCRHLCLCMDCDGFIDVCPVCQVMKNASVQVCMS